jgi:glycosidase
MLSAREPLLAQDSVDVTFYYTPEGNPSVVYLPGEFNGWSFSADPMTYDGETGVWYRTKRLRVGGPDPLPAPVSIPGAYQYKFNLNGTGDGWIIDPLNPRNNPLDNNNSYIYLNDPTIHYLLPNSVSGLVETNYPEISAYIYPEISSLVNTGSIKVTIDDQVYENIGDGYDPVSRKFTFIPTEPVSSGQHKLKLYAESMNGSFSQDSTTFIVQAGFIQFLTQSSERYLRPAITVSGKTAEPNLTVGFEHIGEETQQIVSDDSGMFSVSVTLAEGENEFNATTLDNDDNPHETGILRINYFVDHAPRPVILMSLEESVLTFTAEANDPDMDAVMFTWSSDDQVNPEPLNIAGEGISRVISLPGTPGDYFVDLVVTDANENQGKTRAMFKIFSDGSSELSGINSNPSWVKDAVVYEIYLPAFTAQGTFAAAESRLESVKNLGVNVIWLMPIYDNGESINELNAGYNIIDFYKVHPQLGTLADLRSFMNKAQSLGIRVILDSTPNHVSPHHMFVEDIELFRDYSNYRPMFETDLLGDDRGLGQFKRMIDDYTYFVYYSNWGLPNIDYTSVEAVDYMLRMYKYWVTDVGIDGYRMDVYWGPQNRYGKNVWWRPFREEIKRVAPDIFLLGETDGTGPGSENNYADGGGGMDAAYDWSLFGEIRSTLTGGSITSLDDRVRNYSSNGQYNQYTGINSHYFRFIENHDEERIAQQYTIQRARTAGSLLMTIPGIPMIYAGQEVGETSRRGSISWNREGGEETRAHYVKLGEIRAEYPAMRSSTVRRVSNGHARLYSFMRPYTDENALVIVNFSALTITANISLSEEDLILSDSLEAEKTYYMNDVFNDTVYAVNKEVLESFQPVIDPWGLAVYIFSDSAFGEINYLDDDHRRVPDKFSLHQNYPNPFNPETNIAFSLPARSEVKFMVYDLLGQRVYEKDLKTLMEGEHTITWRGVNTQGRRVGSGVYIYRLTARGVNREFWSATRKMIIVK